MKPLTVEQYNEIVKFVQTYHQFGKYPSEDRIQARKDIGIKGHALEYGLNIKYITCSYDTRDASIWNISFNNELVFSSNHFVLGTKPKGWKYDTLYDLCMAYLKGEFKPKQEFYKK